MEPETWLTDAVISLIVVVLDSEKSVAFVVYTHSCVFAFVCFMVLPLYTWSKHCCRRFLAYDQHAVHLLEINHCYGLCQSHGLPSL